MSRSSATQDPSRQVERFERDLLTSLGLGPGASNQDIETAHDAVVRFLDEAPADIRRWAAGQEAVVDASYALLRGPRADVVAAAAAHDAIPGGRIPPAPIATEHAPVALDDRDWEPEAEPEPRRAHRGRRLASGAEMRGALVPAQPAGRVRTLRRLAIGAVAAVGLVAVVVVGYNFGAPSVPGFTGTPAPEASGGVDTAQVAALMRKLAANPNDLATLQGLGDLYYAGGDYATAATWDQKVLKIDPKNVTGLLALGAADFNVGQLADAETAWRQVLAIDAKNVEAHYDLGFMYLSKNPPDLADVRIEWNQVVAIAPDSDVAKTVATHLASLAGSPSPGTSGGPTAAPASGPAATPGASAGSSPAPSAVPSATPVPSPTR